MLLKVSHDDIKSLELYNKLLNRKRSNYESFVDTEKFNIDLKNRNIYIMIEDEEVYIKYLRLPNIKNKLNLNSIIKNELIFLYGKKSEKIFYTYTILDQGDNELEILVFCIYCDKLNCLEQYINNNKVKKINLVQFCFLNYFESVINEKDYIFIFKFNKSLYLLGMTKKKLVTNKVIKVTEYSYGELIDGLNYILDKLDVYKISEAKIYSVNFYDENFIKHINNLTKYEYVNLGNLSNDKIIEHFTITGK